MGPAHPGSRLASYHPDSHYRKPNLTLRRADVTPIWNEPVENVGNSF
jgi:hypothetical protein